MKILMDELTASMKWLTRERTSAHGGQYINVPWEKTFNYKIWNKQSIEKSADKKLRKVRGRGVPWGPGGLLKAPLWSLVNIMCVAANITRGAAVILHGLAVILRGMTSIWSNVHDILHFQHQFFEMKVFLDFQREKYTFFQKCSKIGLVAKKTF